MVKNRPSGFTAQQRKDMTEILSLFGRNDIILKNITEIVDQVSGRVTDTTIAESTIKGDLQFGPEAKKVLEDFGHPEKGDGVFFCEHNVSINEEDIISVDSIDWVFVEKRNLPTTGGSGATHQEWLVKRKK